MSYFQKAIFLESEGDKWYLRNNMKLVNENEMNFYSKFLTDGKKVLEIGCSNGIKLDFLRQRYNCEFFGIDPSSEAIELGSEKFPEINLNIGTADKLNFEDDFFDFVIFGFCFYLIDRDLISKVVAEADRVLKNKGYLGITDFDVKIPQLREYSHFEGVKTYKMDYSQLFLAYPHFVLIEKYCYSHNTDFFVDDINERVSSLVLYKDHSGAYSLI